MTLEVTEVFCTEEGTPSESSHGGDIAFWKNRAVLACGGDDGDLKNDGFVILDISDPTSPTKLGEFRCVASASDIAIWGHLVFLAVDTNNDAVGQPSPDTTDGSVPGKPDCEDGLTNQDPTAPAPTMFRGIRIIDIAQPQRPRERAHIPTNHLERRGYLGAHNLTVLPDLGHRDSNGSPAPRLLVYAATPSRNTNDVVQVPLDDPEAASVAKESIDTLHTPEFAPPVQGCHDIAVFMPRRLGACNGLEGGTLLWDMSSPLRPQQLAHIPATLSGAVPTPGRRDHSSAFSWDGNILIITDENLPSLTTNSCVDAAGTVQGALWFYDISAPGDPQFLAYHAPHLVVGNEWCHPKQLSVVPLPSGRDVVVVSWLGGGTTVVDFTHVNDPNPLKRRTEEVGYFAADPVEPDKSFVWAAYWYNGFVYANNALGCFAGAYCIGSKERGLDVFSLGPAFAGATPMRRFNFATQECLPRLYETTRDFECPES